MKTTLLLLSFFTFHSAYGQGITGGGTGTYPTPKSNSFVEGWVVDNPYFQTIFNEDTEPFSKAYSLIEVLRLGESFEIPSWFSEEENSLRDNPVEDYSSYIEALKESSLMDSGYDINIYAQYVQLNKYFIQNEILKTLHDYWKTDLESPAQFTRYQHNPDLDLPFTENLNWNTVHEDVDKAISQWINESQSDSSWSENTFLQEKLKKMGHN